MVVPILLPIFLILVTGIFSKQIKIISIHAVDGIEELLFKLILPILMLYTTLNTKFTFQALYLLLIMVIIFGCLFGSIYYFTKRLFLNNGASASFKAMNACNLNAALIGIPLLTTLLGKMAIVPASVMVILVVLIFFPIGIILVETSIHKNKNWGIRALCQNIAFSLLRNPIIMAIPIGIIINEIGIPIPTPVSVYFKYFADSATALALFTVGFAIEFRELKKLSFDVIILSIIKTIIMPTVVLLVMWIINMPRIFAIAAITASAIPPAKMVYILAAKYDIEKQMTAINITLATLMSFITIPIFISISMRLF